MLRFHDSMGWLAQKERNDLRTGMDRTEKAGVRLLFAVQKAWSRNGVDLIISNHEDGVLLGSCRIALLWRLSGSGESRWHIVGALSTTAYTVGY